MEFVKYNPQVKLENQFTVTYGGKGAGKSTFGLSMNEGEPILVVDLDRRSYSARETAREKWNAQIVEIPGLEVNPDDKRSMDEILGKKQISVSKKGGGNYNVWALDKKAALDVRAMIREGLAHGASCPRSKVASIFIDDAKVLGRIWAACETEDGRISSVPKLAWGDIYGELAKCLEPLTRTSGCTKDVLFSHHVTEKYVNDEKTGVFEPHWIDRVVKLCDNVIEHYVNEQEFQLGLKFTYKAPADNAAFYGRAFEGLDLLRYDVIKAGLLGQMEL